MWTDKLEKNKSLKELTTWKIGGSADYFLSVETPEELEQAAAWARQEKLPVFILGGGSNLLVADSGYRGLVLKPGNRAITVQGDRMTVGAGANLQLALQTAIQAGLSGLEWAQGIPGTMGGAIRGNAGAYGGETKDCLLTVKYFDLSDGSWHQADREQCAFRYRDSYFAHHKNLVIWQADFQLVADDSAVIKAKVREIALKRLARVPTEPSAGSVFNNLWVKDLPATAGELIERYAEQIRGGKLACGIVNEDLGFKGRSVGGALVSPRHGNFVINTGQATAAEVIELMNQIKRAAQERYGLELVEEIEKVGF